MNAAENRAPAMGAVSLDRVARQLVLVQLLDDILEAMELWQSAGVADGRWVAAIWTRRGKPWADVELPLDVQHAKDGWSLHAALLRWQQEIVQALLG